MKIQKYKGYTIISGGKGQVSTMGIKFLTISEAKKAIDKKLNESNFK